MGLFSESHEPAAAAAAAAHFNTNA